MVAVLAVAGCSHGGGGDDRPASSQAAAPTAAVGDRSNLKGVCPATVVIQTHWYPQTEFGAYYQLVGPNPTVDAKRKVVNGPLYDQGRDTGVRVEVRSGGPATGFKLDSEEMYADRNITLGQVNTDEAIRFSGTEPTLADYAVTQMRLNFVNNGRRPHPGQLRGRAGPAPDRRRHADPGRPAPALQAGPQAVGPVHQRVHRPRHRPVGGLTDGGGAAVDTAFWPRER
jgi:hypothetical protein